jgi:hypothetical protein
MAAVLHADGTPPDIDTGCHLGKPDAESSIRVTRLWVIDVASNTPVWVRLSACCQPRRSWVRGLIPRHVTETLILQSHPRPDLLWSARLCAPA